MMDNNQVMFGNEISKNLFFLAKKLDKGIRQQKVGTNMEKAKSFAIFMSSLNDEVKQLNDKIDEGLTKQ